MSTVTPILTTEPSHIPRVIVQTGRDPHDHLNNRGSNQWKLLNPEYTYLYFSDLDCKLFITQYFGASVLTAFNTLKPGAFKADLFRYCYLYINGGVYADLDTLPLVPLSEIIVPDVELTSCADRVWCGGIYQAFLAAKPNLSLFIRAIGSIVFMTQKKHYPTLDGEDWFHWYQSCLSISGPKLLSKVTNNIGTPGYHTVKSTKIYLYHCNEMDESEIKTKNGKVLIEGKGVPYCNSSCYYDMYRSHDIYN